MLLFFLAPQQIWCFLRSGSRIPDKDNNRIFFFVLSAKICPLFVPMLYPYRGCCSSKRRRSVYAACPTFCRHQKNTQGLSLEFPNATLSFILSHLVIEVNATFVSLSNSLLRCMVTRQLKNKANMPTMCPVLSSTRPLVSIVAQPEHIDHVLHPTSPWAARRRLTRCHTCASCFSPQVSEPHEPKPKPLREPAVGGTKAALWPMKFGGCSDGARVTPLDPPPPFGPSFLAT